MIQCDITCLWTLVSCSRLFSRKEIFCFWAALPTPSSQSSSALWTKAEHTAVSQLRTYKRWLRTMTDFFLSRQCYFVWHGLEHAYVPSWRVLWGLVQRFCASYAESAALLPVGKEEFRELIVDKDCVNGQIPKRWHTTVSSSPLRSSWACSFCSFRSLRHRKQTRLLKTFGTSVDWFWDRKEIIRKKNNNFELDQRSRDTYIRFWSLASFSCSSALSFS